MENSICLFATNTPTLFSTYWLVLWPKIYKFGNQTNRMRISYYSSTPFFGTEVVKEAFRDSKNNKGEIPL